MESGQILYNVKKVIITPLDETTGLPVAEATPISISTAEEIEMSAKYSEGEEKTLRVDNEILATAETDDILISYDIKLKDNTFKLDLLELLEGGTITKTAEEITGYKSPMMSDKKVARPFKLELYVAEYKGTSIKQYVHITFNYCKGKTPNLSFKKDFFAPEIEIKAKENSIALKPIKEFAFVTALPV